uniref:Uncharacterized protein n=1 Tax=Panagrolaimus sp. JU765 TaxID=591449 RepID=A0AC34RED9_9BILA
MFTKERGCTDKLNGDMENVLTCNTSLCNSFNDYPIFVLQSNDTVICSKTDKGKAFFINCPIVPDKPSCSYDKDVKFYGGYHRDCYQDSSEMLNCSESKCNSVEKIPNILRCVDNNNNPKLCEENGPYGMPQCKVVK